MGNELPICIVAKDRARLITKMRTVEAAIGQYLDALPDDQASSFLAEHGVDLDGHGADPLTMRILVA